MDEVTTKLIEGGYTVFSDGRVLSPRGKFLKPQLIDARGYIRVWPNSKPVRLHRLVATAFVPNPDNKPEVNHIDGNKSNNCASNLEWVTRLSNMQHARTENLWKPNRGGEGSPNSKLSSADVAAIRSRYVPGRRRVPVPGSASSLAREFGCDVSNIYYIVQNKTRAGG